VKPALEVCAGDEGLPVEGGRGSGECLQLAACLKGQQGPAVEAELHAAGFEGVASLAVIGAEADASGVRL